jgi:tetratricopeptide (TPR) repeat protein
LQTNLGNLRAIRQLTVSANQGVTPASKVNWLLAGILAMRNGDYGLAAEHFSNGSLQNQDIAHWYLLQALERSNEWRSVIQQIRWDKAEDRKVFVRVFIAHRDQLNPEELQVYEERLLSAPDMILDYCTYLISVSDFSGAIGWAKRVPDYQNSPSAQILIGKSAFYSGELEAARTTFEDLSQRSPSPDVTFWLGKIEYNQGDALRGIEHMREALENLGRMSPIPYVLDFIDANIQEKRCTEAVSSMESWQGRLISAGETSTLSELNLRLQDACPSFIN